MGGGNLLNMTIEGKCISDEEANSWEDSMTESDDTNKEDYDDEGDYDEEVASPNNDGDGENGDEN